MTETFRLCECGERPHLYSMEQKVLLPWMKKEIFFVQCPGCGKRTRAYDLVDMAILRWNQCELMNKKRRR